MFLKLFLELKEPSEELCADVFQRLVKYEWAELIAIDPAIVDYRAHWIEARLQHALLDYRW